MNLQEDINKIKEVMGLKEKGFTPSEFETNKETIIKNVVPKMGGKNIIIGDSQTPFVDMNTTKASRISTEPGMS